jgi:diaminopimelate decarboxylase
VPECRIDDILLIKNTGAYGFAMASNYNSRMLPQEVLVIGGEDLVIRER